MNQFINTGLENYVALDKIVAIFSNKSNPIKATISKAKEAGTCIDLTFGRKCKSVIMTTHNQLILSPTNTKTLTARIYPDIVKSEKISMINEETFDLE